MAVPIHSRSGLFFCENITQKSLPLDQRQVSFGMTNTEARKEGVRAHKAGRPAAPALNQKFIAEACGSATDTLSLLESYNWGYTIAHLAEDEMDLTMPSVIELARILAS
jgi:hypothetical protein